MAQTLSADGVGLGVVDDGLGLALFAGAFVGVGGDVFGCDLVEADDGLGEAASEFLCVGADNGAQDVDGGHQAVGGGCDGGELCVVLTNALIGVHEELDLLAGAHLRDQDVRVAAAHVVLSELFGLAGPGLESKIARVDAVVFVELVWIGDSLLCLLKTACLPAALEVERETDTVLVRLGLVIGEVLVLLVPFQPAESFAIAAEGDEAEALGEDFVLDDGGVLGDEDVFDGECRHLGDENAAKGIGERGVDAGEGEGEVELGVLVVELDAGSLRV